MFEGTIVEESLNDNRFLNSLSIQSVRISDADNPADRWHLYKVRVSDSQLSRLSKELKPEKWYMHFWNEDRIVAVFPDMIFTFKYSDKPTWNDAIEYGLSLGIPIEQLDFVIK